MDAILSLEQMPSRCAQIPEQARFTRKLRQLIYKSHRIIFEIKGDFVIVVRVYPAWSRPLETIDQLPAE